MARVWGWQRATGGLDAGPWSGGVRGGRGALGHSLRCVGAGGPWSSLGAQNPESSEGAGPGAGRAVREGLDLGLWWDRRWALEIDCRAPRGGPGAAGLSGCAAAAALYLGVGKQPQAACKAFSLCLCPKET